MRSQISWNRDARSLVYTASDRLFITALRSAQSARRPTCIWRGTQAAQCSLWRRSKGSIELRVEVRSWFYIGLFCTSPHSLTHRHWVVVITTMTVCHVICRWYMSFHSIWKLILHSFQWMNSNSHSFHICRWSYTITDGIWVVLQLFIIFTFDKVIHEFHLCLITFQLTNEPPPMPRGLCFPFGTIAGLEIVAPSHTYVSRPRATSSFTPQSWMFAYA